MGIANYGSFRAGLREIKKDLEWVGDKIESVFDNNSFEVSDKNTKIIYPKILSDEIEKLDNWRNYNSSTDEQQVMTKIQDLASLTLGEDRKIINQELNRMNIPLRIPNKKKRQIINRKYGILREEEKEIKTDANIA